MNDVIFLRIYNIYTYINSKMKGKKLYNRRLETVTVTRANNMTET